MHEPELFARRASSFGSNAAAYARHRPGYAEEAVEWVVGESTRVLDLAAGTGRLTETLLAFGLEVTAVEPDDAMRAELSRLLPDVAALKGTAEQIPFPDGSFDAVLAGQAFHWFDNPAALGEIVRVLRPGGVFGALWNYDDTSVPWVAELGELSKTSVGQLRSDIQDHEPRHPGLTEPERATFRHVQRRTVESMLATLGTHSQLIVVDEAERAKVFDRIRTFLWSRPETSQGDFDRPLITEVARAFKRHD
ncbi:class I SAM-dependent methyltransferase [Actinokineospora sp. NBRC 105648]|uniref:class I SAM-dependent methyltransferase n=1 Tax=Actinokineospora sp. NBRC 105648 TaxID=3032206 RepID=UPI0024A2EDE6|nr:class I SAM-dependent methyltransferase [Actinokineospora sp. NBRC 105648]GLZ40359.1 type 11 methyltransferase [Actinokineospora sp. NBRC 105648]